MPGVDILFLTTVFLDPRNRPGIDSLPQEGIHRTQINVASHNIVHECPLRIIIGIEKDCIPHILSGASSSRRIG
jgi:hypothetical protein